MMAQGIPSRRGIFCNRTLNLRSIRAVGYDMDYTLIHYHAEEWEQRAYEAIQTHFSQLGWPVGHLKFDPAMVCRGLIVDTEKGNLVKANRFGFIKHVMHGTKLVDYDVQRRIYSRTVVDLADRRWIFLNTLFSLSEGCFYAQLIDLLDQKRLPETLGYLDLYQRVRSALDAAHMEGQLKVDVLANPDRYVDLDPEMPLALLDQKYSGKKLMLITNSEWSYTLPMMNYAFNRFLPNSMTWRDLFDVVIVSAKKPDFFSRENPLFEVATEEGLLRPWYGGFEPGRAYWGGSARGVEKHLGISGDEILYVGDHMFGDVWVSKSVLRWRTALILRELESEIDRAYDFRDREAELTALMAEKTRLEGDFCLLRVESQRIKLGYGPKPEAGIATNDEAELQIRLSEVRVKIDALDRRIGPLAQQATQLANPLWGVLMRTGNDKSHLAYQMERYADIYTSRVSNFLHATPFVYFRSLRGRLPHEPI